MPADIQFTRYRKVYFILAAIIAVVCLSALFLYGLKPGIDFTGGAIMEVEYNSKRPSNQEISGLLSEFGLGEIYIQPTAEKGLILRMKDINEDTHQKILSKLAAGGEKIEEKRFESVGPSIGKELKQKTASIIFLALMLIVLYIALAFRKIQRPLKSYYYAASSMFVLCFDILVPLGIFAYLGRNYSVEITIPIIAALLTVLGSSINNTVIVFDRIRENILKRGGTYEDIVNRALNETLTRQLNTGITALLPMIAIFLFGGETLKYFSLALIIGIITGIFSSLFLASPILVSYLGFKEKRR